jgi:hypothetical protein
MQSRRVNTAISCGTDLVPGPVKKADVQTSDPSARPLNCKSSSRNSWRLANDSGRGDVVWHIYCPIRATAWAPRRIGRVHTGGDRPEPAPTWPSSLHNRRQPLLCVPDRQGLELHSGCYAMATFAGSMSNCLTEGEIIGDLAESLNRRMARPHGSSNCDGVSLLTTGGT